MQTLLCSGGIKTHWCSCVSVGGTKEKSLKFEKVRMTLFIEGSEADPSICPLRCELRAGRYPRSALLLVRLMRSPLSAASLLPRWNESACGLMSWCNDFYFQLRPHWGSSALKAGPSYTHLNLFSLWHKKLSCHFKRGRLNLFMLCTVCRDKLRRLNDGFLWPAV